ncbi:MAG: hypothetical protein JO257_03580 [Deltaproteobacteria bacterium]|nr:hypothetical protein [Deltaproteobacteria bacterium]
MNRRLLGRLVAVVAVALLVAGGLGSSWRSLRLEYFTIELGLSRVTVCGDCEQACTGMHSTCEATLEAQYGKCDPADCHVEAGKKVCASKACREEGHCATQLHRCKTKCATTPACETTSPFDAGKTLQLGPRDRHLMALAGIGGVATLFAGGVTALLLLILAIRPRATLATVAIVVAALATVAGVGFLLASGMKSPVGGTSIGWAAIAWVAGGALAITAAVLLRAQPIISRRVDPADHARTA